MKKYEYGRIARLDVSLTELGISPEKRQAIMKNGESIVSGSTNAEKAGWFASAMRIMDETLDEKTKYAVRENCACCLGGQRLKISKKIFKENDSFEKRIAAANDAKMVFGNGVKLLPDGSMEVSFFREDDEKKRCPCLPGAKEALSITYCYCCGGHVKHHLQTALGMKLDVELLSSVLSSLGKKGCRFILREKPEGKQA